MNTNNNDLAFSIIGCGRLGISLAVFLSRQGFIPNSFASKHVDSAKKARDFVGAGMVYDGLVQAAKSSSIVFITTPDTVIEPVCDFVSGNNGFTKDSMVFHLSGALSSDILKSAKEWCQNSFNSSVTGFCAL